MNENTILSEMTNAVERGSLNQMSQLLVQLLTLLVASGGASRTVRASDVEGLEMALQNFTSDLADRNETLVAINTATAPLEARIAALEALQ